MVIGFAVWFGFCQEKIRKALYGKEGYMKIHTLSVREEFRCGRPYLVVSPEGTSVMFPKLESKPLWYCLK